MKDIKKSTIGQLLKRFPKGFVVSPSGKVFEILSNTDDPMNLPMIFNRLGGYLAVAEPELKEEDKVLFSD